MWLYPLHHQVLPAHCTTNPSPDPVLASPLTFPHWGCTLTWLYFYCPNAG